MWYGVVQGSLLRGDVVLTGLGVAIHFVRVHRTAEVVPSPLNGGIRDGVLTHFAWDDYEEDDNDDKIDVRRCQGGDLSLDTGLEGEV